MGWVAISVVIYMCSTLLLGGSIGLDFSMAIFNVDEDDGSVEVCMDLTNLPAEGLECDLIIPLNLMGDRAGE